MIKTAATDSPIIAYIPQSYETHICRPAERCLGVTVDTAPYVYLYNKKQTSQYFDDNSSLYLYNN